MAVAGEQVLVQTLVPQSTVEGSNKAVLHRVAPLGDASIACRAKGGDVMPVDLSIFLPLPDSVRGSLGAGAGDAEDQGPCLATRPLGVLKCCAAAKPRPRGGALVVAVGALHALVAFLRFDRQGGNRPGFAAGRQGASVAVRRFPMVTGRRPPLPPA